MNPLMVKDISRVNESKSAELLQPNEVVELVNMTLSKELQGNIANKRGGIERFNTNQVESSGDIVSIEDVEDSAGSNYLLSVIGTKLKKSLNGTGAWSNVKTGLTSGLRIKFAVYDDILIGTNGADKPFYLKGTAFASEGDLEITPPDIKLVTLTPASSGGALGSGIYRWKLCYITDKGEMSNVSMPITDLPVLSDTSTFGSGSTNKMSFANLPVSSDPRVVGRRLFRTKAGGSTYYFVASLNNTDTTYDDITGDSSLTLSITPNLLNTPLKAKEAAAHRDRIFFGNITKSLINIIEPPAHTSQWIDDSQSITEGSAGSGSLEVMGQYKWAYSFVDELGTESALSSAVSFQCVNNNSSVTITAFSRPRIGASGSYYPKVVKTRLYRTKASGSVFYFIKDIGFLETATTDGTADASLTVTYPKTGESDGTKDYPSGVVFSNIGKPNEFPEVNLIPVYPDDKDKIVGIFDDVERLIIFKQKSILAIYTNGSPQNWQVIKLVENYGADSFVCKNGNEYFFLYEGKPYIWNGGAPEEIFGYENSFNNISSVNDITYLGQWYVIAVLVSSDYKLFIWDNKIKSWYTFTLTDAKSLAVKKFGTSKATLLIGDGVYVCKYGTGVVDNEAGSNSEITCTVKTKTFLFPDGITLGRARVIHLNYNKKSGQNLTITITDPSNLFSRSVIDSTNSGNVNIKYITDSMTGVLKTFRKINFQLKGTGLNIFYGLRFEYRTIKRGSAVAA